MNTAKQNKLLEEFRRLQEKRKKIKTLKGFTRTEKGILVLEITKRMREIERMFE